MKLATQFGLVSLTLLLVPWAGCAFLEENERALRQAQANATAAVATTTAAALAYQTNLIYPHAGRVSAELSKQGFPVSAASAPPAIDGWLEDEEWRSAYFSTRGTQRRGLEVGVLRHGDTLSIGVVIREPNPLYRSPQADKLLHSDRLELRLGLTSSAQYVVAPQGPGPTQLLRVTGDVLVPVTDAYAAWQETESGFEVEISLPLPLVAGRLGLRYVGVDESGEEPIETSPEGVALPWLISSEQALDTWLESVVPEGMRITVFDRWQWPLAMAGQLPADLESSGFWVLRRLYRWILPPRESAEILFRDERGRQTALLLKEDGSPGQLVVASDDGPLLIATAPIVVAGTTLGSVAVARPLEEFLSLTDQAFAGLLRRGMLVLLFTGAALLGFAGLTSWRLKHLVEQLQSVDSRAASKVRLKVGPLNDEIDGLAAQFNHQLEELDDYQRYLTSLNQTLAHELRTPVAIIASSLDNLALPNIEAQQREELLARAKSGIERLQTLFAALQEARRLEQALDNESQQPTDLAQLLSELADAYSQTFPSHRFTTALPNGESTVSVAPEQIVQAIDKLIDNAVSYAPSSSNINLSLEHRGLWWRLSVTNHGPRLPEATERSLFEPLISHRSTGDAGFHMGLGLHIVRLIAQHHGGEPFAQNLADGSGVRIGFSVQR